MLKTLKFLKDFLLFLRISVLMQPLLKWLHFLYYFNKLVIWVYQNKRHLLYGDFYTPLRNYQNRYNMYEFVAEHFNLKKNKIIYLEFGVASAASFKWWLDRNNNRDSFFAGFDTFEGLPEDWGGFFEKGSMSFQIPHISDQRVSFRKGLFQNTLPGFLHQQSSLLGDKTYKRVIHLDADLYSSTAFTLSQLYPYLEKGDIIIFDEFNVALHEFKAYYESVNNFYIKLKPVAAVNNFYQTAFTVE